VAMLPTYLPTRIDIGRRYRDFGRQLLRIYKNSIVIFDIPDSIFLSVVTSSPALLVWEPVGILV
jgi:hypothetical protein